MAPPPVPALEIVVSGHRYAADNDEAGLRSPVRHETVTLTDSGLTSQGLVFESLTVQSPEDGREGADPSKGGQT